MATLRSFEELDAWQSARALTKRVYEVSREGPFARDFGLRDQICRASVSIMSNIAEGFERGGNKEFGQFLSIAKGSAGEVRSQLYVALDQGYLDLSSFEDLKALTDETSRLIGGLMAYLRRSDYKGAKRRK